MRQTPSRPAGPSKTLHLLVFVFRFVFLCIICFFCSDVIMSFFMCTPKDSEVRDRRPASPLLVAPQKALHEMAHFHFFSFYCIITTISLNFLIISITFFIMTFIFIWRQSLSMEQVLLRVAHMSKETANKVWIR